MKGILFRIFLPAVNAIEIVNVTLMEDDLGKNTAFVRRSRHTYSLLGQNIVIGIGGKVRFSLTADIYCLVPSNSQSVKDLAN